MAAEESLPGIVSCEPARAGVNGRIIAESERERLAVCPSEREGKEEPEM